MAIHSVYGIVLAVVFGVIGMAGIILLIINRHNTFIKCRNFKFLLLQTCGLFISAEITAVYIGLRPDFSCYLYYFGALMPFAGFMLPMLIRCWEYCVNFHISTLRSKARSKTSPEAAFQQVGSKNTTSWFFRNRWASSSRFLNRVFFVLFWVLLTPIVPYFFEKGEYEYKEKTGGCDVYPAGIYLVIVIALANVVAAIFLGVLIRRSHDAFHIKTELFLTATTWIIILLIWAPYSIIDSSVLKTLSPSFWIVLGLYFTFAWTCIMPIYLAFRSPAKSYGDSSAEYTKFVRNLDNPQFRNALHDFLLLQFCQENILFYEEVIIWKGTPHSDKQAAAREIYNDYILDSGLYQVNLAAVMRNKITHDINKEFIDNDIFDKALQEVLDMIYNNSYLQFKAHPLSRDLDT